MIKNLLNYACFTCKIGIGKESIALHNRDKHVSEGIYTRVYPNRAPAVLVECLKCDYCGHSWIPKTPLSTNISFGTAKYSQAGKLGRDTLLASPNNWIITEGGNENALTLDAGNPLSYPGTGTIWTDLSGNNNNGTLINGLTFDSGNGGSIVFDGINQYKNVYKTLIAFQI